jgi:hypothetical protein
MVGGLSKQHHLQSVIRLTDDTTVVGMFRT